MEINRWTLFHEETVLHNKQGEAYSLIVELCKWTHDRDCDYVLRWECRGVCEGKLPDGGRLLLCHSDAKAIREAIAIFDLFVGEAN